MAFVLVQHLDPKHDSKLAGLLEKATQMPVCEAIDGMVLRPNRVHVMPSNVLMTVVSGRLVLAPRGSALQPIDCFLRSLAADQGELAVGVILSGTGADGTAGVEAVKTAGGITFAEDSTSARFPAMPENANASGFVDFVLSPENIGVQLARIARHPRLQQRLAPRKGETATEEMGAPQARILRLLSARVGADFTHYKRSTLHRRIAHRMVLRGVHDEVEYLRLLEKDSMEVDALFRDALIHVTLFVIRSVSDPAGEGAARDYQTQAARRDRSIWVPDARRARSLFACDLLSEVLPSDAERPRIRSMRRTSAKGIARALGRGEIDHREVHHTRLRRSSRHAWRGQVTKALREACIFARQNVAAILPFARIDLIGAATCSFISMRVAKKVLPMLHCALNPAVIWFSVCRRARIFDDLFEAVDSKRKSLPRRKQAAADRSTVSALLLRPNTEAMRQRRPGRIRQMCARPATRLAPALESVRVIIDSSLRVLEFRGRTSSILGNRLARPARFCAVARTYTATCASRSRGDESEARWNGGARSSVTRTIGACNH
jgi:two-component system CheB/CheR fusion protein